MFPLCYSQAFLLCDKGSKAFYLFVCSFTYLRIPLIPPESFHVNSEQVITEREMALTVDAMNPLPSSQENPQTPCFQSQDCKNNHTCI